MTNFKTSYFFAAVFASSLSACTGAAEHDHAAEGAADHAHDKSSAVDHSQFGHMSAIYLCGNDQLQTTYTDTESKLAYRDQKIEVERNVTVIDNAFAGESYKGTLNGQPLFFQGKGYDASLRIGTKVISCEKISCIPLGGPH